MVAGIGRDSHFQILLQILHLIRVSTTFDFLITPGDVAVLTTEHIINGTCKSYPDCGPQGGFPSPWSDLVDIGTKVSDLSGAVKNISDRRGRVLVSISPRKEMQLPHFLT